MTLARRLVAIAAAALVAALPAAAKEGVTATLTTRVPLDAAPGSSIQVGWTLTYKDDRGRRQPFGAGGLYVRLLSANGAPAQTADARGTNGRYSADVRVPAGGIGDVRFGLVAWSSDATGTHRGDMFFPIANPAECGAARVERDGRDTVVRAGPFTGVLMREYDVVDGRFSLHVGGYRIGNGLSSKIAWELPPRTPVAESLVVTGRRITRPSRTFRQEFALASADGIDYPFFPSIISPPTAGCWRLTFTSGKTRGALTVLVRPL